MVLRILCFLSVLAGSCAIGASALGAVDPGQRTVTTGAFHVQWSLTDPEEILGLSWKGSPNLTNSWAHPFCPQGGDSEYFGNSWNTSEGFDLRVPVGWGTTGLWDAQGPNGATIASSASGCFATFGTPVNTTYHFFGGNEANRILVQRRFTFGATPFPYDLRAYIPRLYPRDRYGLVIHPDAAGTALATEVGNDCEFGCEVANWDGSWFAIHDPSSGSGLIVRHAFSPYRVALWVDMDGGSATAASSVLVLQPPGGFTGTLVEVESLCFYDSSTWTPSLTLPAGC